MAGSKARLRVCASCEWVYLWENEPCECPQCGFASYSAHYVYAGKAYTYLKTQEPWKRRKLDAYECKLNDVIHKARPKERERKLLSIPFLQLKSDRYDGMLCTRMLTESSNEQIQNVFVHHVTQKGNQVLKEYGSIVTPISAEQIYAWLKRAEEVEKTKSEEYAECLVYEAAGTTAISMLNRTFMVCLATLEQPKRKRRYVMYGGYGSSSVLPVPSTFLQKMWIQAKGEFRTGTPD